MLQCNKMTCPNCHTVSCYICRKIIVGYDHFSNVGDLFSLFCMVTSMSLHVFPTSRGDLTDDLH
ncbi:hypothetical protein L210DRAFT_2744704 [Boletus edulis BED1]|uniref:Uncharacterized protein n=1 Tax=Boletus edulis BED1 TaxID=1328754 RepID=A0AAD4G5J3_BOLED|nr:hypothetical protein L210DRAFT_2744704 [Boletus edulis BED1]